MRRETVEVISLGCVIVIYALFREYIAGRAIFIVPGSLVCVGYAIYIFRSGGASLEECGIGRAISFRAEGIPSALASGGPPAQPSGVTHTAT
jgi:hypothetical protein